MSMGDSSFSDSKENYIDGYVVTISGSTATAINTSGNSPYYRQPIAVFGISFTSQQAPASGSIAFHDASASGDSDLKYLFAIPSGSGNSNDHIAMFTRPLKFDKNVMYIATTVTGTLNILYKNRYS